MKHRSPTKARQRHPHVQAPLGPRQEELLSYLQGLAPAGDDFEFRRDEAAADLGFYADAVMHKALRKLVRKGFVERLHAGQSGMKGRLRVLRRLETVPNAAAGTAPEIPGGGHEQEALVSREKLIGKSEESRWKRVENANGIKEISKKYPHMKNPESRMKEKL